MQNEKKKSVNFGTVTAKVDVNPKTEIHIKTGAKVKGVPCVDVRKFVKTKRYTGYTKSGLMIPEAVWGAFMKAIGTVKVK